MTFTRRSFASLASSAAFLRPEGWPQAPELVRRIEAPAFPNRTYPLTSFAPRPDDALPALSAAISRANAEGGGRVLVPRGSWFLNGPLHLKSNVNLHLEEGATLRFTPDPARYLPLTLTRWEGTECYNYSPLVYAWHASNLAITGRGTLDGNAKSGFATWKPRQKPDQEALREMGVRGVPVVDRRFGPGHFLRTNMVEFFGCRQVLLEDITILDSPMWVLHPVYCDQVIVRRVHINSFNLNNDGIDPDSSSNLLIEDCTFDTGDDAVVLKSGRDQEGWRTGRPTENVLVRNCRMNARANALAIGSEMSGGVRNVWMENCQVRQAHSILCFKANLDRGGLVENVWARNLTAESVGAALQFTTAYHSYRGGNFPPTFRNFVVENVVCERADTAIDAVGVEASPIQDVRVSNFTVKQAKTPTRLAFTRNFEFNNVVVNGVAVK
jgi:polygalacturonase